MCIYTSFVLYYLSINDPLALSEHCITVTLVSTKNKEGTFFKKYWVFQTS